jgi:hypothetical protein
MGNCCLLGHLNASEDGQQRILRAPLSEQQPPSPEIFAIGTTAVPTTPPSPQPQSGHLRTHRDGARTAPPRARVTPVMHSHGRRGHPKHAHALRRTDARPERHPGLLQRQGTDGPRSQAGRVAEVGDRAADAEAAAGAGGGALIKPSVMPATTSHTRQRSRLTSSRAAGLKQAR